MKTLFGSEPSLLNVLRLVDHMRINLQTVSIQKIVLFDDGRSDEIKDLASKNNVLIYNYNDLLNNVE